MKLLLVDTNPLLCHAWSDEFAGLGTVTIHWGPFESIIGSYDCLVSPANSFGLMDGGIDAAITKFFGTELQAHVQARIWKDYGGEQPVGTCLMVETGHPQCPWLAHCPTMTVPMDVSGTRNPYLAMMAALVSASRAGINILASPGLGTFSGRVPLQEAARQMRYAYDCWQGQPEPTTWNFAGARVRLETSDRNTHK